MEAQNVTMVPRWYWIVSIVALLWMLFGTLTLVMDLMTDEAAVEGLSEAQRQLYAARPTWLLVVYAVAVLSGLAGVVGLLMRQSWAVGLLAISLAAVVVQFGYTLFGLDAIGLLGPALALPFPLVIAAVGIALLVLARRAKARGWIR